MSHYRISDQANDDLDEILTKIAESSPRAAVRMSNRFTARFQELAATPELGRFVNDLQPGLKRVNEGAYGIFFLATESGIEVARVIHGMRDLPARFRD